MQYDSNIQNKYAVLCHDADDDDDEENIVFDAVI